MKAIDNSELSIERIITARKKIKMYREIDKQGNSFDTFYESDLAVIESALLTLEAKLDYGQSLSDYIESVEHCTPGISYDTNVLKFIWDFAFHEGSDAYETIRHTFRAGYCYYFACMLRIAFQRGEVCWAAPFSHCVWLDDDGTPYDIEGIYFGEAEHFIPITWLGKDIESFKHVPNQTHRSTEESRDEIIRRWKENTSR